MNVALTRAKNFLFIIGRCDSIIVNPYWKEFVIQARAKEAIINVPLHRQKGLIMWAFPFSAFWTFQLSITVLIACLQSCRIPLQIQRNDQAIQTSNVFINTSLYQWATSQLVEYMVAVIQNQKWWHSIMLEIMDIENNYFLYISWRSWLNS